jgi:penicillin-binding protein 1B
MMIGMRVRYRSGDSVRWQLHLRRWHLVAAGVFALVALGLAAWLIAPFWELSGQFGRSPTRRPSRLYGAPVVLEVGERADVASLVRTLGTLGYRSVEAGRLLPGDYRRDGGDLAVYLRSFPTPQGWTGPHSLEIRVASGRVRALRASGRTVQRAQLEPPLVATFYGPDAKERRPVRLEEVPEDLVFSVLAAEDARFFQHGGISVLGMARAMLANLKSGKVSQGGSTLTQQLVKNLFLTHERTVSRKARELVLALLLDLRYSKAEILEAYLNEIYLGAAGQVNLMGFGAASWAYFGKEPARLTLAEGATLAGMIPAPARYDPLRHPEAATVRRDLTLRRLSQLGWVDQARIDAALAEPLVTSPQHVPRRRAPYFADLALRELQERFTVTAIEDQGYTLLSTLSLRDQAAAEEAVPWGLAALEKGYERGREGRQPLQSALVSVHAPSGAIRAYVGGRDYKGSQFDRAGVGRRQPGSSFKPVVYAAALRSGAVTPASFVEDTPLTIKVANRSWSPENNDHEFRGWVTVRQALEKSLNVPTVRVAMRTGLGHIVQLAQTMGVSGTLQEVPSVALGAFEVTPLELATVYATLANQGVRPPVHALDGVLGPDGTPVAGQMLPAPQRVLEPEVAYVTTLLLQGVVDRGTGAAVRRYGLSDPLAGKTGTSNDAKDSWFAGYSPDRATVVWVGYDESLATRLSGARGALPIWAKFTGEVRPAGGYPQFPRAQGVVDAIVDPSTGELATDACPWTATEVFVARFAPREVCSRHSGWFSEPLTADEYDEPGRGQPGEAGRPPRPRDRRHGGLRGWLDKVFGEEETPPPPEDDGSGDEADDGNGAAI